MKYKGVPRLRNWIVVGVSGDVLSEESQKKYEGVCVEIQMIWMSELATERLQGAWSGSWMKMVGMGVNFHAKTKLPQKPLTPLSCRFFYYYFIFSETK